MDPVSEAMHIAIQVEPLRIMWCKVFPESQFYLVIKFTSGFPLRVPALFFLPDLIQVDLFQLLHLITANLEQDECNLYSFYKVKYFFIEIKKSFLMKMSPPPYRHIERMREIFFVHGQTNNVRKAASGKHRTSHDLE